MDHNANQDGTLNRAIVIALTYRLSVISATRRSIIPAIFIFGILSWHLGRWFPVLFIPLVIWIGFIAISIHATYKVLHLTGISRTSQRALWVRYKTDPAFARQIDIAAQDPNLLG